MPQSWWASDVLERGGPVLLYSWVVLVMVSIVLHELAHGWAAIRLGDDTPIHAGHMTLNPLVHMGPVSLLVFALAGIAWGAMPVDPSRIRGRHGEALMAFAGPAMNLLLALIFAALAALLVALADRGVIPPLARSELAGHGWAFFSLGVMLNLALAIFNLAPVAPLDGSRVLSSFSRRYRDFLDSEHGPALSLVGLALMFLVASEPIFDAAGAASRAMLAWLVGLSGHALP